MKVVILAGGLGTRFIEETSVRPKPMVEIGGKPILWHIMQTYAAQGFNDFIVALGYEGDVVKDYFVNQHYYDNDLRVTMKRGRVEVLSKDAVDWRVQLVDTGDSTQTGGRLLRLAEHLGNDETFMLTYGDGLADVDVPALVDFHRAHGRVATLTAVRSPLLQRPLALDNAAVRGFREQACGGPVNGGFFVFEPGVFDYLRGDEDSLESCALTQLARDGQLMAYRHEGFWQCMDTAAERDLLEALWRSGAPPWMSLLPTASLAAMNRLYQRFDQRTQMVVAAAPRGA